MNDGDKLISLLGRSERDEQVKKMLTDLGVATSLKRPKRGENEVYVEPKNKGVDLLFDDAEAFPSVSERYTEGELLFSTVFFYPSQEKNIEGRIGFPLGVPEKLSRKEAYELLGQPIWSNPRPELKSDKWMIGSTEVFIQFKDDEASIYCLVVSYNGN